MLLVGALAVAKFKNLGRRIVNGTDASIEDYPFTVSIQEIHNGKAYHICGGSIFQPNWVLTVKFSQQISFKNLIFLVLLITQAAHCLEGQSPEDIVVEFGTSEISDRLKGKMIAIKLIINEGFNSKNAANDIGLIKTQSSININDEFKVKLPSRDEVITTGMDATAIGKLYLKRKIVQF